MDAEARKDLWKNHVDIKRLVAEHSKNMPNKADFLDEINRDNLEATKQDVQDWQQARLLAIDVDLPDWVDLIRVYDDIIVDSFLTGVIEVTKDKIKATEFEIVDSSGKVNEEKQEIFEQEWFFKFLDMCTETFFYPFTMVQLGDMVDGSFVNIKQVKREYIIPQFDFIKSNIYSIGAYQDGVDGWSVLNLNYDPYYILIKSDIELGLFDRIASHALGKKHMLIYLWRYGEIFGLPTRVGKTDIDDPLRRKNMEFMLKNMGNNLWASMHPDDELTFVEGKSSSGNQIFLDAMNYSNSEMSRALLGSDSLMSEKSFVGSAEIGERLFEAKGKSQLRKIKFIINNQLIPRMIKYGLNMTGYKFQWVNEDKVSYDQKLEAVRILSPTFKMDAIEVGEKLGFTLDEKVDPQEQAVKMAKALKASSVPELSAMYNEPKEPTLNKGETKKEFTKRYMSDTSMMAKYSDSKGRMSACNSQYKNIR